MYRKVALIASSLVPAILAQQVGTMTAETHPPLTWQKCTGTGSCTTQSSSVVLDANWRWLHLANDYHNCYDGNTWNATACPDGKTCAANCALDGADYSGTYGITTSGNALTLKFVTGANIGSRVYLMAPGSTTNYQMFNTANQEFVIDVDVSNLPCGLNGALYFSQMDADGGMAKYSTNKAGAKYGTGYCDSQCPRDIKFINGIANSAGWSASPNDTNSISAAFTPHPCTVDGQTMCGGTGGVACSGANSTAGVCDQAGCDFNSFRMGDTGFYGPGKTIDTKSKFTVVTQFVTADNTTSGALTAIRRLYVQNGVVIQNSMSQVAGVTGNEIDTAFCAAQKTAFGDTNTFAAKGGLAPMTKPMVLVLSIWDDHAANMLWLDAPYPPTKDASSPGVSRGTCSPSSGAPPTVEAAASGVQVVYSNIKFGDIGSTFSTTGTGTGGGGGTGTTTTSAPAATQTKYGQCGGIGYSGPTACASGSSCSTSGPYYSQCL
ncbi:cellulase CEL7A [Mycena floridula]|nr:cellulase CEL7A [Mycena floridula]